MEDLEGEDACINDEMMECGGNDEGQMDENNEGADEEEERIEELQRTDDECVERQDSAGLHDHATDR